MLATPGPLPRDDGSWAYEFKWDGVRAVAYLGDGELVLRSRNDRDVTTSYPEVAAAAAELHGRAAFPEALVLDGEIVAFDESGRPSFGTLQSRMHVADPAKALRLAAERPAVYLVFDVLFLDDDLLALPYRDRRARLVDLDLAGSHLTVPPSFEDRGEDVLDAARRQGLEGVVAKRLTAPYQPGRRSRDWIKVKLLRTQEVVVVGWAPGRGRRGDGIGALLLAVPDDGALRYAGRVGTGFSDADLRHLAAVLAPLTRTTAPLTVQGTELGGATGAGAHWVEPHLVGEVAFGEWTADHRLRHPTWRGLRPDKAPSDVVRE